MERSAYPATSFDVDRLEIGFPDGIPVPVGNFRRRIPAAIAFERLLDRGSPHPKIRLGNIGLQTILLFGEAVERIVAQFGDQHLPLRLGGGLNYKFGIFHAL